MFTGLIQDVGIVRTVSRSQADLVLTVETRFSDFVMGESIAVSGACLSVTAFSAGKFSVFASSETVSKTGIGELRVGARVNLERALKMGDSVGGHWVSGHVDSRVTLLGRNREGSAEELSFSMPPGEIADQIAAKGSVALDGVSLTVNRVTDERFTVMIIPITQKETTLRNLRPGDKINLETDLVAKYIARQLSGLRVGEVDLALLERTGFIR